jgi:oligopeptide transport system ATP-binding protein
MMSDYLIEATNVYKYFPVTKGLIFSKQIGAIKAVDGIDFKIAKGETFGVVGESGCGKTTTAKLLLLLETLTQGTITFEGQDISGFAGRDLKRYRGFVQAVFQDPYSSLSPRLRVGSIVGEPLVINTDLTRKEIKQKVGEILEVVGIHAEQAERYPHEFSGGQRQRIAVARALTLNPRLIILDEPVSALDVSIRAQIMNLLKDIQKQFQLTYMLIAHDLAVVKHMSDHIGVMYLGKIVETASSKELCENPRHPYTLSLLSAALPSHPDKIKEEVVLSGDVPSPMFIPSGCRFHTRCPGAREMCAQKIPELRNIGNDHWVACHL